MPAALLFLAYCRPETVVVVGSCVSATVPPNPFGALRGEVNELPRVRRFRPVSEPGFDEDDINAERTYWEPSVSPNGLLSPEIVKLKVCGGCCLAWR